MRRRSAFTLVELLVTMAIIGLLTGLLVTAVNRSLLTNNLAQEVTLLDSTVSQTRLLAGSTQQATSGSGLQVDPDSGYYAIYIPAGPTSVGTYAVVKISTDLQNGTCAPDNIYTSGTYNTNCLIQQVNLTGGVTLTNAATVPVLIAFKAPTEELVGLTNATGSWQESPPAYNSPFARLTYDGQTATVSVSDATAQVTATYQQ